VKERGQRLRKRSFAELQQLANEPVEKITVESRPATIAIIVLPKQSGELQIVIQGFLRHRLIGSSVALDGFYKHPDETVTAMQREEFWQFD